MAVYDSFRHQPIKVSDLHAFEPSQALASPSVGELYSYVTSVAWIISNALPVDGVGETCGTNKK